MSGVMNLPTMISQMVMTLVAGLFGTLAIALKYIEADKILVNRFGYHTPFAIFGSALTAIGSGLMSTFFPSTDTVKWIGYQILAGAGRGSVLPMVSRFFTS